MALRCKICLFINLKILEGTYDKQGANLTLKLTAIFEVTLQNMCVLRHRSPIKIRFDFILRFFYYFQISMLGAIYFSLTSL